MSEFKPKISAKTIEEFKEIQNFLSILPEQVYCQIDSAKSSLTGVDCIFRNTFEAEQKFFIPKSTTHIKDFGDYVGVYCGDFFFRISEDSKKKKLEYIFV